LADRFYMPELPRSGTATLTGDEAHHLSRVRRLAAGAKVELFDGRGRACEAVVMDAGKQTVTLELGENLAEVLPPVEMTLASAIPKGERFDWLVEKATELGVTRFVPLLAERSVVEPRSTKLDRLRRSIVEACKQCGRSRLMTLDDPVRFVEYLGQERSERLLIAHPGDGRLRSGELTPCALAIGPEGGFTDREIEEALATGWRAVSLGPTLLRIETAGLAAAAAVLSEGWVRGG
jgi:16S rRNA (uracil1498-N3)-methyltransferase